MKTEFTLRVVLSQTLHANLLAYAKRTGLSLSNVTRCCLAMGLDGQEVDDAEIDALIAKLQAKKGKRPAADARAPGGAVVKEGGEG